MISMRSRLLSSSKFTYDDMEQMAIHFRDMLTDVERVYVYESKGSSSGTMILVTSDNSISSGFMKFASECLTAAAYSSMSAEEVRFDAFAQLWPEFAEWRKEEGMDFGQGAYFDILICPPDWQERAGEMSIHYFHTVPFYLSRLAKSEPLLMA